MSLFRKKSKPKEAPLPRSSSGVAYYLSKKQISGLMKPSSTLLDNVENEPTADTEPAASRSLLMRTQSADGRDAGELSSAQGTFLITAEGLKFRPEAANLTKGRSHSLSDVTASSQQGGGSASGLVPESAIGLIPGSATGLTPATASGLTPGSASGLVPAIASGLVPSSNETQQGIREVQTEQPGGSTQLQTQTSSPLSPIPWALPQDLAQFPPNPALNPQFPEPLTPHEEQEKKGAAGSGRLGHHNLSAEQRTLADSDKRESVKRGAGGGSQEGSFVFSVPVKMRHSDDVSMTPPSPGAAAALCLQKMDQLRSLRRTADGLCTKLYTLCRLCTFGPPDVGGARMLSPKGVAISVDSFLFGAGVILPEHARLRTLLVKRFPERPQTLNLEKVDRPAVDAVSAAAQAIQQSLEPWCLVLVDLMIFTECSVRLLVALSRQMITLSPGSNALVMDAFMGLFVAVVRTNMLAERVPRKLLLQVHALAHSHNPQSSSSPIDPAVFNFVAVYDSPVLALQKELESAGPKIGEVLDAIGPQVLTLLSMATVQQDGVLSPWPIDGALAPIQPPPAQSQYDASPAVKQRPAPARDEITPIRNGLPSAYASTEMGKSLGEGTGAGVIGGNNPGLETRMRGDGSALGTRMGGNGPGLETRIGGLALDRGESPARGMHSPLLGNVMATPPRRNAAEGAVSGGQTPVKGSDEEQVLGAPGERVSDGGDLDENRGENAGDVTPARGDVTPARGDVTPGAYDVTPGTYNFTPGTYNVTPSAYDAAPYSATSEPDSQSGATPGSLSKVGFWAGRPEAGPAREQLRPEGLKGFEAHLEWVCFGFLACPGELGRGTPRSDLRARLVGAFLSQTFLVPLFRDECIHIHEEYAQYVLPRLAEQEKQAKAQRGENEEWAIKVARRAIKTAADVAPSGCGPFHRERRVALREELETLANAFTEVPGLLPHRIENVFGALSLARTELLWHFHHLGAPPKSRAGRAAIPDDVADPTVGSLLSATQLLAAVVREFRTAVRSHAAARLLEARERVRFFSGLACAGLDLDDTLKGLLVSLTPGLDEVYLTELVKGGAAGGKLQGFQVTWIRTLGLLSNSKSSVNLRHLELATSQGMVPGLARECNDAYQIARCVDELDVLLDESSSLKVLHFYQPKLLTVLQQTLDDPLGYPEDACSWLRLADAFPQNAHKSVPQELPKLAMAAVEYTENVLEYLMAGLQSMVAALDSESGWAALDRQVSTDRAVLRLNLAAQTKSGKRRSSSKKDELQLSQQQPGFESAPAAAEAVQSIAAAVQRLTSFVTELGGMGPVKVMDRVYAPREYLRERLHSIIKARLQENYLAGLREYRPPQLLESDLHRFEAVLQLIGRHVSIDVTRVLREVLLSEAYAERMRDLQAPATKKTGEGPKAVAAVIADWYIDFIILDLRNDSAVQAQSTSGSAARGTSIATIEQVTRVEAFESLLRVFGPYGADRLIAKTYDISTETLTKLETILRRDQGTLQELQATFHHPEKRARSLAKLSSADAAYALTTRVGQCIALREQIAEACATVLKQHAPLIHTVLGDAVRCLPPPVLPEGVHAARLRRVAHKVGGAAEGDDPLVYQALQALGKVGDVSWRLLPVLWAAGTGGSSWKAAHFDARARAFSNNAHCFAKGLAGILACSERVGFERRELHYQLESARIKMLTSEGGTVVEQPAVSDEPSDVSTGSPLSDVVRRQLGNYVAFTVALTLADWDGYGAPADIRPVMTKLIFLDQLCELSPHLSRSTLEQHVPHTLLRSIYQAEYTLQALPTNVQH